MTRHLPLAEDPSKAASDIRITAIYTAPTDERRREAAALLWESDRQRIADEPDLSAHRIILKQIDAD